MKRRPSLRLLFVLLCLAPLAVGCAGMQRNRQEEVPPRDDLRLDIEAPPPPSNRPRAGPLPWSLSTEGSEVERSLGIGGPR